MNIVTHPVAGFDPELVKNILKIPTEMKVITLLVVGGKAEQIDPLLKDYQV